MRKSHPSADIEVYHSIGNAIANLRAERGVSQQILADAIGLTRTSVTNIEKGRQKLLVHTLLQVADFFGVSVSYFVPPLTMQPATFKFSKSVSDADEGQISALLTRLIKERS
jgi:transcriptional regulator with XRE-family HTH domain